MIWRREINLLITIKRKYEKFTYSSSMDIKLKGGFQVCFHRKMGMLGWLILRFRRLRRCRRCWGRQKFGIGLLIRYTQLVLTPLSIWCFQWRKCFRECRSFLSWKRKRRPVPILVQLNSIQIARPQLSWCLELTATQQNSDTEVPRTGSDLDQRARMAVLLRSCMGSREWYWRIDIVRFNCIHSIGPKKDLSLSLNRQLRLEPSSLHWSEQAESWLQRGRCLRREQRERLKLFVSLGLK